MKRVFTDSQNREWHPVITLYTAARAKRNLNINLEDIDSIHEAIQDPVSRLDLLFLIVEDEAIKRGVSAETFGKSLTGDSIKGATEALLYGIADFFEDSKKRTAFTNLIEAMRAEADANVDYMIEKAPMIRKAIQKAGATYRKELDKELKKAMADESDDSGNSSGSTPESSAE